MYWTTYLTSVKPVSKNGNEKITHVVTVRILNEGKCIIGDLIDELHALMIGRMVNATLQDAASVSVSGNFDAIRGDSVVDELRIFQQTF